MGETSRVRPSISLCARYLWVPRGLPVVQVVVTKIGVGQLGQASGRGIYLSFSWADH
jgi:hypothetical protein